MTPRFVDTFFFLALLDSDDHHHASVLAFANTDESAMVTTRWILAETANALASSARRADVAAFLGELEIDPNVTIVAQSDDLYFRGLKLFASRPDKNWSSTDCISFVVMEDFKLQEALTRDRHFVQAGFIALFGDNVRGATKGST
jgi:predicted nucleic acid-binding protein